ncbi:MAG: exodeoxyribonuclease VII small subunit [Rothia sp. (in: high G+C Gram-positive bacteria)]|uniref:exodeoxyribonuclease VII small subunit n=1 Tax=Rothia sp. (in: high G+C Gram-positive bacteria) TaxID=1885016 RepID=UPI0026F863B3|nr:exodeoxyribonuclease VII small subunit [Rothia sp. (in: high G+C Gram-positive bacteria)]
MSENIEFKTELNATPVEQLTYEQAREELLQVVARMESGASTLEESIALWERGEALAQRCEAWLDGAQATLDSARQNQTS